MTTIKCLVCPCGEDVYENDYGDDPNDGFVWCINCGKNFPIERLVEEALSEIHH